MTDAENPIPIPVPEWLQVHHRVVPFIDGDERRGHGMVLLTTHDGRRRWVGTDYARLVVLDGGCQESEVTALLSHRLILRGPSSSASPRATPSSCQRRARRRGRWGGLHARGRPGSG